MKYLSICIGIEAASTAWHSLGWEPLAFSEIEPFPCAVLAHHWPHVPNLGDMTKYENWPTTIRPDVIVGGTPCQAFSVAGLRKGLADPRGNLTLTFLAIVSRYRPKWVVWENVPGVLSDGTGAFGSFLGGLGELGYGFAYRVLDAQFFGVAQRRRRVFVVAYLGDWRPAAAVLFERESLCGNPAPSREARENASTDIGAGFTASSFGQYEPGVGTLRSSGGDLGGGSETLAVAARMVAFGEYACDESAREWFDFGKCKWLPAKGMPCGGCGLDAAANGEVFHFVVVGSIRNSHSKAMIFGGSMKKCTPFLGAVLRKHVSHPSRQLHPSFQSQSPTPSHRATSFGSVFMVFLLLWLLGLGEYP